MTGTVEGHPSVLITGALAGIGRETALAFAREGARLTISGRNADTGAAIVRELEALGAEACFVKTDVRDEEQVSALVDHALARFGTLDVAVNNAGTEGAMGPLVDQTKEAYQATFDTNVLGMFFCLKYEMRTMLAQKRGSIINLSSIAGKAGTPGAALYVASKHAVEGLTKCAALEGASAGVRVNAVAPGPVTTTMLDRFTGGDPAAKEAFIATMPAGRAARPEEVAQTILFLASDKAPYITGESIAVDGAYGAQ